MGFENRKSTRIKTDINVCFWVGSDAQGPGTWGQGGNLSESGLAFASAQAVPKGELILLEFSLPSRHRPLRPFAEVVHCEREEAGERRCQLRVKFVGLEGEELLLLRQHILQVAHPRLAAATGWGRVLFSGALAIEVKYRELEPAEQRKMLEEKAFFSAKEATYLKRFQHFLEQALGSRTPGNFRLIGSRALKEHSPVWLELSLAHGQMHALAGVLWSKPDPEGKSEAGLSLTAYHKEEAIKIEKGA